MNRTSSSFAKGIGTGVAMGIAVASVTSVLMKNTKPVKKTKKKMGEMLETMSCVCDNLSGMIR